MTDEIDITLDFESYYSDEYTLSKMTAAEYILDPRFKASMCGVKVAGHAGHLATGEDQMRDLFSRIPWDRTNLICHNVAFDGAVLAWRYGCRPKRYTDTLGMARAVIGTVLPKHGLGDVAKYLGFDGKVGYNPHSGEAKALAAVKGVLNPTPQQLSDLGYYCAHAPNSDINLTWQVYNALKPSIPDTEWEVIDWCARMFINPAFQLDGDMLLKYDREVRKAKEKLVKDTGWPKGYFTSNEKFAALLRMHDVEPPKKWSKVTGKSTYAFAKSDLDFVLIGEEHPDQRVRELVQTRLEVKSSIEETRAKTLWRLSQIGDGWMPVPLNYSGALNTHRLSGGGGYNVQNFKRGGVLRDSIRAPEGKVCLVADLSGIELRVAIALSGDVIRTEMQRRDEDLYCHTATGIFGELVVDSKHEMYAEDPMKQRRLVGKVADLSLQYGSGPFAFQGMLRQMGGLRWSDGECAAVVDKWRALHPDTTRRWTELSVALRQMVKGQVPRDWPIPTAGGQPVFWFEKDAIVLPRGLRIKYPNLRWHDFEHTVGEKTVIKKGIAYDDARAAGGLAKLYGGKMFENLCQALATCIYMEQAMHINRVWPVSLSVHDEVVLVGTPEEMSRIQPFVEQIMRTSPEWWPNLPLNVESDIAKRYGDAK